MLYSELGGLYNKLESTTKILEMREILADFLKAVPAENLSDVVLLLSGRVFPLYTEKELGVAENMMIKAIMKVTGHSERDIREWWRETGDLGLTCAKAIASKSQHTLLQKELTVEMTVSNLRKAADMTGPGTVDKKLSLVSELISSADERSVVYLVRTILGQLRVGVGWGTIRDAIAIAFGVESSSVERAFNLICDFGEVARIAKDDGEKGLNSIELEIGRPYRVMLSQTVDNLAQGFDKVGRPAAVEYKYDGMRVQIHKRGDKIVLFTRRLDEVTKQFPEIVEAAKKAIQADNCIVEGEAVGYRKGQPVPFQEISRRIKRKYDIDEMAKEIPTITNLFDCVFLDGKSILKTPFKQRRKKLEKTVKPVKHMVLAEQLVTSDEKQAEKFYQEALDDKQEGVMMKNLDAAYQAGSRVGYMIKIKPIMESLDLVIVGAEWGEGKRSKWLSSFLLACRDPDTEKFLECGKMATGLTDKQFEEITERLKPLIEHQSGRKVKIRPEIVVEIGYQEIQKSPTYASGFALRFPRLIMVREDRSVSDANTIKKIRELYESSKGEQVKQE